MNKHDTYVKLTDKYIYVYSNKTLKKYDSKYIKNGKVDNTHKLIIYLNNLLNKGIFKRRYIFILDTLLCNSDLFVYKYVFENMGLLNYKIINDIDILKNHLNDDNIIIMNWSSSINYCYINNNEIVINKFNEKIINRIGKKYIVMCGDTKTHLKTNIPVFNYEDEYNVIFNFLKESN
ncbi:MAG: hypothetical protein J1F35_03005 [Erysipelotrichales bacterium]|nr:hypothetical protein [Erysipelotrichales bacterium]